MLIMIEKITNQELYVYLNKNISGKAIELGREQNPELIGLGHNLDIER